MTIEGIESLYKLIDQEAQGFYESVVEARSTARNERELQTKVTFHIERFAEKVGVKLVFREEYTVATGRADAVYNRLIIEIREARVNASRPDSQSHTTRDWASKELH